MFSILVQSDEEENKDDVVLLSDTTRISGSNWGALKQMAMFQPDYVAKSTFARYLNAKERKTLEKLIAA